MDPVCGGEDCDGREEHWPSADPRDADVTITNPRYIGLRVKRYGPMAMSLRLVGEVVLTSVPSRRNKMRAQTGRIQGTLTRTMPSIGSGKPGILGQSSSQLIARAKRT